ncbi:MAG: hypothetical protein NT062_38435 [Proteobacteria bacterium]|nr:hypothetical protein [Pseudomonadota bacterium]
MTRALAPALLALLTVGGGCSTPPLSLVIGVSPHDADGCGGPSCSDVTMACAAVAGIRILDPREPKAPYISMCEDVLFDRNHTLCSLARIDLDQTPLPIATLEVQVVVFPRSDVPRDASDAPICPANVEFDGANGFPLDVVAMTDPANPDVTRWVRPAIGGRAYYHPGDTSTVVEMGCFDLAALNAPTCEGEATIAVTATVVDFDTNQSVSIVEGNRLAVAVGEPTSPDGLAYNLDPADTASLKRTVQGPVPAWGADVPLAFAKFACLEVLDTVPEATATLTCKPPGIQRLDITGTKLPKETLDQILVALGDPPLDQGLTIGIVIDELGPAAGHTVITSSPTATIRYLSSDGSNFNASTTTASGIFVSQDAPFGTSFQTSAGQDTVFAPGGLVRNKITMVPLRFVTPVINP